MAELIGITNFALLKEEQWTSGNLNDTPNGVTDILCWNNSAAFSNLPVINDNNNAMLFTFRHYNRYTLIGGIQFFCMVLILIYAMSDGYLMVSGQAGKNYSKVKALKSKP